MTKEEREIFHQLLDRYLDEPQSVRGVGTRLMQIVQAEIPTDGLGSYSNTVIITRFLLYVKAKIETEEIG